MTTIMTRSPEAYQAISVLEARAYLLAKGWKISEKYADKGLLLSSANGQANVVLPLKETYSDYSLRIAELVNVVARIEERDIRAVLSDMSLSGFDIFRVRLIENARDGTIPLESTKKILEKSRELLLSAARATVNPRKVYGPRCSQEIEDYMHKVRLGQTEQGSYIFTLLSPVTPEINSTLPLPFDEPIIQTTDSFDRRVTNTLRNALDAAYSAAQNTIIERNISPFLDAVEKGVSANFCEALSIITHEAGSADFSVSWANTRPNYNITDSNAVRFTSETADVIEEAAKHFKAIAPIPDTILKGYVFSLDKDKNDPLGNVQVKASIEGVHKTVKLALNDIDYAKALEAHNGYKTIVVEGELIQRGKFKVLEKISNFSIDQNDD